MVDQHNGEARPGRDRLHCGDVHALLLEARQADLAELVIAETTDIAGPPPEPCAADHRRGDLSTRKARERLDAVLRVAARKCANEREKIDAVLAETDDVKRPIALIQQTEGNPHGG